MSIKTFHPKYSEFLPDWRLVRDAYAGERKVKEAGTLYLPATPGQILDGMEDGRPGRAAYNAYRMRAQFPDLVSGAIESIIGIMHSKPPKIEVPAKLEPMLERATVRGESAAVLLRRINEAQLTTGRFGLLLDVPDGAPVTALPYIATYEAEDIINWDDSRSDESTLKMPNLVVLDESEHERGEDFTWEYKKKYRVCSIGPAREDTLRGIYQTGLFDGEQDKFDQSAMVEPSLGGRRMEMIPFQIINSKDLVLDPDDPPLLGLSQLCMSIYRLDADYRQALFMQGQDTLVVIGYIGEEGKATRVGAGAKIDLPMGGDAKFIGTNSAGLPEMRQAIESNFKQAAEMGGKLIDTVGRSAEAAEALRIRVSARTATINSIAITGAKGLESVLRMAAVWVGANPEEVTVEPNLDFADTNFEGRSLVDLMTAKSMGLPLSLESIHWTLRERNLTEFDFETELDRIADEAPGTPEGRGDVTDGD